MKKSRKESTVDLILRIGIDEINRLGYTEVKIEDICRTAGIGRSTFYHYFSSKEELVSAFFKSINTYTPERMTWIFSTPHPAQRIIRTHLSLFTDAKNCRNIGLYTLHMKHMLTEPITDNPYKTDEKKKLLIPMIIEAQEKKEILNPTDPEKLSNAATTLQWGNISLWCTSGGSFNRLQHLQENLEALYGVREDLRREEAIQQMIESCV